MPYEAYKQFMEYWHASPRTSKPQKETAPQPQTTKQPTVQQQNMAVPFNPYLYPNLNAFNPYLHPRRNAFNPYHNPNAYPIQNTAAPPTTKSEETTPQPTKRPTVQQYNMAVPFHPYLHPNLNAFHPYLHPKLFAFNPYYNPNAYPYPIQNAAVPHTTKSPEETTPQPETTKQPRVQQQNMAIAYNPYPYPRQPWQQQNLAIPLNPQLTSKLNPYNPNVYPIQDTTAPHTTKSPEETTPLPQTTKQPTVQQQNMAVPFDPKPNYNPVLHPYIIQLLKQQNMAVPLNSKSNDGPHPNQKLPSGSQIYYYPLIQHIYGNSMPNQQSMEQTKTASTTSDPRTTPPVPARTNIPRPTTTQRPSTPLPTTAQHPSTPRPTTTRRPSAPRPTTTRRPSTPRPTTTRRPSTPRPTTTRRPSTPLPTTTPLPDTTPADTVTANYMTPPPGQNLRAYQSPAETFGDYEELPIEAHVYYKHGLLSEYPETPISGDLLEEYPHAAENYWDAAHWLPFSTDEEQPSGDWMYPK